MALTTITCVQRDPVDACHEINNLNVQTPLPPPNNRRLWLHHLSWPFPVLQRGRPFTARLPVPHINAVSAPSVATGTALVLRVWRTREKFRSREHSRHSLLEAPDPA